MTTALIAVAWVAVAAIGYLTVAGGERAERIEQAACHHPSGRTTHQLTPTSDRRGWAPHCRRCGTTGEPIRTNTTQVAFDQLDTWDHTCPTDPTRDQ